MLRNEQNESQKALITRRNFAQKTLAGLAGLGLAPLVRVAPAVGGTSDGGGLGRGGIRIARVTSDFEREPLIRPFGFKGGRPP